MTTPICSNGEAPDSSPSSDDVRARAQSAFDLLYATDPATIWRMIDEAAASQLKPNNHEPLALRLDIMTTQNPYTEIHSREVRIGTSVAGASWDDDVLLGSEQQALKEIERALAEGFTMTIDFMIDGAFLTGQRPIMSTENNNST